MGPDLTPRDVARSGSLCRAQQPHWFRRAVTADRQKTTYRWEIRVPAHTKALLFIAAVTSVQRRHEALRTRFCVDDSGYPAQEVVANSALPSCVTEVASQAEFDEASEQVSLDSISMHVVLHVDHDTVARAIAFFDMTAMDGHSMAIVQQEVYTALEYLEEGEDVGLPLARWHPLDQAQREQFLSKSASPPRGSRGWAEKVQSVPPVRMPLDQGRHQVTDTEVLSPSTSADCTAISGVVGISAPMAFLAGLCTLMSVWLERDRFAVNFISHNRTDGLLMKSVGDYSGSVTIPVDLRPHGTFASFARQLAADVATAIRLNHVGSWSDDVMATAKASCRDGFQHGPLLFFNYHDYARASTVENAPKAPRYSSHKTSDVRPHLVFNVRPTTNLTSITVRGSQQLLNGDGAHNVLSRLIDLINYAASSPLAALRDFEQFGRLPRFWEGALWRRHRGGWLNLADVDEALRVHPLVSNARSRCADDQLLVSEVIADEGLSPHELAEHMRSQASRRASVIVPERVVINRVASPCRELTRPDVHETHCRSACNWGQATVLLHRLVQAAVGGGPVDMHRSFAEAGGTGLAVPSILAGLAQRGWAGTNWQDLIGMTPLMQLSRSVQATGRARPF